MDAKRIIALGDVLREFEAEANVPAYEPPASALPPGCPLYANLSDAGKLFAIGDKSLRALAKRHADFPALRVGSKILVDVPGLYAWLNERNGLDILEG